MKEVWLSPKILNWEPYGNSSGNDTYWQRPHEIWSHADDLLKNFKNDFDLIDSICTLKRAVDTRLKQLNNRFGFKELPYENKPKGLIQQIAHFGFIKPLMLLKLLEIRNLIEHQYKNPPNIDRCFEFLEFVWYFLKSTDSIVRNTIEECILETEIENTIYQLVFETGKELDWRVTDLRGDIPNSFLSYSEVENWIKIKVDKNEDIRIYKDIIDFPLDERDFWGKQLLKKNRKPNDIEIHMFEILGPKEYTNKFIEIYLKLAVEGI